MNGRWTTAGLVCAILAGCAEPAQNTPGVDPAIAFDLLRDGTPILRCRDACLDNWRKAEPTAEKLAAAAAWRDLATLVIKVGYQDDLSVYYLGRAAEGLGYKPAAISYYRQSVALSRTSIACFYLSKLCGGVGLPQAASARLAALDLPVKRPLHRLPPASAPGALPQATPGLPVEPVPEAEVPAAPASAQAPPIPAPAAPPAATPTAKPAAGDFIEPPPANR